MEWNAPFGVHANLIFPVDQTRQKMPMPSLGRTIALIMESSRSESWLAASDAVSADERPVLF